MTNLLFGGRFLRGGSGPIVSSLCIMECFDVRQTLFLFLKEASRQKQMKQYSFYKRQSQREREKTTVSVFTARTTTTMKLGTEWHRFNISSLILLLLQVGELEGTIGKKCLQLTSIYTIHVYMECPAVESYPTRPVEFNWTGPSYKHWNKYIWA